MNNSLPIVSVKDYCIWFLLSLAMLGLIRNESFGQEQDKKEVQFKLGVYFDLFYGYDFNTPDGGQRLPYIYQYSRHNEVNLNHGVISFGANSQKFRSNLAVQAGTYVDDNYALEKGSIKNIYDANVGFALDKKSKWWIDAGIFGSSWIGMQSTFAYDNVVVAHNLNSEYTPYYYAGTFLSFQPDEDWRFSAGITNGWQRIARVEGNSLPSTGWQILYANEQGLTFNLSAFFGTDDPDSTRRLRQLNNFYTFIPIGEKWMIKGGFDIGVQQKEKDSKDWNNWYGLTVVLNHRFNQSWSSSLRYETYSDRAEVIVDGIAPIEDFIISAVSINVDYQVLDFVKTRFEARYLTSPDAVFPVESGGVTDNFFLLITVSANWNKVFNQQL